MLFRTPVSMADSGQRSLISKIIGIFLYKDKIYADKPTNKGGELTKITSYLSLVKNNPA